MFFILIVVVIGILKIEIDFFFGFYVIVGIVLLFLVFLVILKILKKEVEIFEMF